jgi:hypothetical protein
MAQKITSTALVFLNGDRDLHTTTDDETRLSLLPVHDVGVHIRISVQMHAHHD